MLKILVSRMFGGVKITLILCATMIVCCVLFISYNEYTNRYSLLTTNENSVYIFDKKSTVLNKCDSKGCSIIETKLATKMETSFAPAFQQSKMFDSNPPMTQSINEKISKNTSTNAEATQSHSKETSQTVEAQPVKNDTKSDNAKPETENTKEKNDKEPEKAKKTETSKSEQSSPNSSLEKDDEFVE